MSESVLHSAARRAVAWAERARTTAEFVEIAERARCEHVVAEDGETTCITGEARQIAAIVLELTIPYGQHIAHFRWFVATVAGVYAVTGDADDADVDIPAIMAELPWQPALELANAEVSAA